MYKCIIDLYYISFCSMGAPVAIETHGETDPREIAKLELR